MCITLLEKGEFDNMCKGKETEQLINQMDLNLIWKDVLRDYEKELVEFIFPELTTKVEWRLGVDDLEEELLKMHEEIYGIIGGMKLVADRLIKVRLKDNRSIILFIHLDVANFEYERVDLGEIMFRYFGRIMEKFRYEYNDDSVIVAAAIYSNKSATVNNYKENESVLYNFRAIDIGNIDLEDISDENPLKLVLKLVKSYLQGKDTENTNEMLNNLEEELLKHDTRKNNKLNLNGLYKRLTTEHKDIYKKLVSK